MFAPCPSFYLIQRRAIWTPRPAHSPAASGGTLRSSSGGCFAKRSSQSVAATATPTAIETAKCRGRKSFRTAFRKIARKPAKSDPATKKKTRRAMSESFSRLRRAIGASDVQQQARRVLERFLHRHQREHRLAPVDYAVVVGKRQVVHRPHHHLAVLHHRALLGGVH